MTTSADILPPRYRAPERIGHGGMGEIYRATDDALGRAVAIKVLSHRHAADNAVRRRFTREALAAARLSGEPHTVTIFDVGEWNERPFIVMEHLSGGSLDDRIASEGAQPVERALRWLDQAAAALDHAHANGVVHRDVKPGNLLLDRDDNVHVADFGIASAAGMDSLTATGTVLGTAGYLSPEQAQGGRATSASDLYSLGVAAFELLTGERPYQRDSMTAEAAAHVNEPVPSASERKLGLPPAVDRVFEKALAKRPANRYRSAGELVAALRNAFDESAEQRTVALPPIATRTPLAAPPPPRRWPYILALLFLAALAGGILAFALTRGGDHKNASPSVRTVVKTVQGEARTVTQQVTTPTPPPAPPPPAAGSQSGSALNNAGFAKMQADDYEGALPLLEQAVSKLQGTGSIDEAYADYNLASTRLHLGRCDGVQDLLKNSRRIQGHRSEIDAALAQEKQQCGKGGGEGD